jgi:hypothetical protein
MLCFQALLMNVTLQPPAVDEVLRLCGTDPYKSLVKTRLVLHLFFIFMSQDTIILLTDFVCKTLEI